MRSVSIWRRGINIVLKERHYFFLRDVHGITITVAHQTWLRYSLFDLHLLVFIHYSVYLLNHLFQAVIFFYTHLILILYSRI